MHHLLHIPHQDQAVLMENKREGRQNPWREREQERRERQEERRERDEQGRRQEQGRRREREAEAGGEGRKLVRKHMDFG